MAEPTLNPDEEHLVAAVADPVAADTGFTDAAASEEICLSLSSRLPCKLKSGCPSIPNSFNSPPKAAWLHVQRNVCHND